MTIELFILFELLTCIECLKITRFEVPSLLVAGDSAYLTCLYDLDGDKLYSIKWYKDDKEFYRFFPSVAQKYMAFPAPGITVDLSRSGPSTVYLRNVTLDTEGQYTCQVSADEPYFGCVQIHRDISVYVPPEESPQITGGIAESGENLTIRCSTAKSKPAANLSWYVNDVQMIPEGATATHKIVRHQDHMESSSAMLNIPLTSTTLSPGDIRLSCEASISNLVTSVSRELFISREHSDQPLHQNSRNHMETETPSRVGKEEMSSLLYLLGLSSTIFFLVTS